MTLKFFIYKMDLNKLEILHSLKNLEPKTIRIFPNVNTIMKFIEAKEEEPHLTEYQLCKKIGTSVSTLTRIRKDLGISSFYRYDVPLKKQKEVFEEEWKDPKEQKYNPPSKKISSKKSRNKNVLGKGKIDNNSQNTINEERETPSGYVSEILNKVF